MKKTSTVRVNENMISKDRSSRLVWTSAITGRATAFWMKRGKSFCEQKVATTPEAMKKAFAKIPRSRHRPGDWDTFPLGQPAVNGAGIQSNRGARAKGAIDHQEQSKRRSPRCADTGTAGANRSRAVGAGAASQRASTNSSDGGSGRGLQPVRARTALVNAARGLVKSYGERLPKCGTRQVNRELGAGLPAELREVLEPLLKEIESLNERIEEYDVRVEKIAKESYPHVELLKQVKGVGTQIALTYVLTLDDPQRFPKSREVGCFLGLRPGRRDSGESQPQMRISKEGDRYLRTMLVQGAHYILGPFGEDSDLRRWGLKLAARGGKSAKSERWLQWRESWRYCCISCG